MRPFGAERGGVALWHDRLLVQTPRSLTTQLHHGRDGDRLELDAAELVVVEGPDAGARVPLDGRSLRLGSAPTCDLVLHDATVSSLHARADMDGAGYVLRDAGSRNGLRVAGLLVEAMPLQLGMRLSLGTTTIEVRALGGKLSFELAEPGCWGAVVAFSRAMRLAVTVSRKLARADITVLVEGESGTGKELMARAIHQRSARAEGPFVVVDCAAIPAQLWGAEILGYEKGAFTGAEQMRAGLLEQARGGTVFLDEIGEVPLDLQPFLLGAIERRQIRRVGGTASVDLDVRIIAATHRNLGEAVARGRFREDLFHRLAVGRLAVPPLRDRSEDVPHLARELAAEAGVELSPAMLRLFSTYHWPGNVRELRNAVARTAVAQHPVDALGASDDLDPADLRGLPFKDARQRAMQRFERVYLAAAIAAAGGNLSEAARRCELSRSFFMKLATRHGLRAKDG